MKLALFTTTILLAATVQASECYDRDPAAFEVTGKNCMNPYNDGPEVRYAESNADDQAAKICYPFQALRISQFAHGKPNDCRAHYYGSLATATYECAK
jgi:hypothetical protein